MQDGSSLRHARYHPRQVVWDVCLHQLMDETVGLDVDEGVSNIQEDHARVVGKRLVSKDDVLHSDQLVRDDDLMLIDVRHQSLENEPLEEFADCRQQQRHG